MLSTIRDQIRQYVARVVRWAVSAQSPKDGYLWVEGREEDSSEPLYQEYWRFMQQYGLRSRPRAGSEIAGVSIAGEGNLRIAVATETPGEGPTDQEDGEVELYAQFGQRFILDKDGQIRITAKGATILIDTDGNVKVDAAGDIVFNGGTKEVARQDDMADGGALGVTMGMGAVAAITYFPPGSVLGTVVGTLPTTTPIQVKLGPGAQHVKA
jgi:phage gp45-like